MLHRLFELGVDVPGIGGVEFLLQVAHLFHELVGVLGGHQFGDLVVPIELDLDGNALLDVLADVLVSSSGLLLQDADRSPGCSCASPLSGCPARP